MDKKRMKQEGYAGDMDMMEGKPEQAIQEDKGNNAGPGTTSETPKGDMGSKSDGSYVGEMSADPD